MSWPFSFRLLFLPVLLFSFAGCGDHDAENNRVPDTSVSKPAVPEVRDSVASVKADSSSAPLVLVPKKIRLERTAHLVREREFTLNIPEGFDIAVAADGLKRVRFMAFSPDRRLFVTDMQNLADNRIGKIYALDNFDRQTRRFGRRTVWLENLRNPNSLAFHTDGSGATWLYVALTDRLLRYRYDAGSSGPTGSPETLATFPDYGNSYREGGWHLTRTVTFGENGKLYISVGSSCNVCEEKDEVRACVVEMNPDGSDQHIIARGLRNAVGIRWVDGALWATNMGADHLGLDKPEDNFCRLEKGEHYGWPYAYHYQGKVYADPVYGDLPTALPPNAVARPWAGFPAHSAPLGFDRFGGARTPALKDCFLVALHGSGAVAMERGYSIVRLINGKIAGDFISGFLQGGKRYGRPCDILRDGSDSFFFTDDHAGILYYVYQKGG